MTMLGLLRNLAELLLATGQVGGGDAVKVTVLISQGRPCTLTSSQWQCMGGRQGGG